MSAEIAGLLKLLGAAFMQIADSDLSAAARNELRVIGAGMRKLAQSGDMGPEARQLVSSMKIAQGSQSADLAQAAQKIVFQLP